MLGIDSREDRRLDRCQPKSHPDHTWWIHLVYGKHHVFILLLVISSVVQAHLVVSIRARLELASRGEDRQGDISKGNNYSAMGPPFKSSSSRGHPNTRLTNTWHHHRTSRRMFHLGGGQQALTLSFLTPIIGEHWYGRQRARPNRPHDAQLLELTSDFDDSARIFLFTKIPRLDLRFFAGSEPSLRGSYTWPGGGNVDPSTSPRVRAWKLERSGHALLRRPVQWSSATKRLNPFVLPHQDKPSGARVCVTQAA